MQHKLFSKYISMHTKNIEREYNKMLSLVSSRKIRLWNTIFFELSDFSKFSAIIRNVLYIQGKCILHFLADFFFNSFTNT